MYANQLQFEIVWDNFEGDFPALCNLLLLLSFLYSHGQEA